MAKPTKAQIKRLPVATHVASDTYKVYYMEITDFAGNALIATWDCKTFEFSTSEVKRFNENWVK